MPTMTGNIAKGTILAKFDEHINGLHNSHDQTQRKAKAADVKTKLTRGDELVNVIVSSGIPLSQPELDHVGQDWLNKAPADGAQSGWWQHLQPLDPVLRQGFIESAEAVESTGYPVDHYWIAAGHKVEVWVCQGAAQITTLIATPTPPSGLGAMATEHDPIWIARSVAVQGKETIVNGPKQEGYVVVVRPRRGI